MSSAAYITFQPPVTDDEWDNACNELGISYSLCTVGANVFYRYGFGGVEINFGRPIYGQKINKPPAEALQITVGSFFMRNLSQIAETTLAIMRILKQHTPTMKCADEIKPYLDRHEIHTVDGDNSEDKPGLWRLYQTTLPIPSLSNTMNGEIW